MKKETLMMDKSEMNERAITAAESISKLVNYSDRESKEQFLALMARDHRTLQQSFTRLALQWLEFVASDEYKTDARNEGSKIVAKDMIEGFRAVTGEKSKFPLAELMPSQFLPLI